MLFNLLASGQDPFRKANAGEAALYALIGFAVVFLGIAFLIFIVWGAGKLFALLDSKTALEAEKAKRKKRVEVDEALVVQSTKTEKTPVQTQDVDEETLAIITAAIMAYYQKNNPKCEFTVKRIKRI